MDMMELRRKLISYRRASRLPKEYQEVEYIKTLPQYTDAEQTVSGGSYTCFVCTNIPNANIKTILCKYGIVKYINKGNYSPMFIASHQGGSIGASAPFATAGPSQNAITTTPTYSNITMLSDVVNEYSLTYQQNSAHYLRIGGWSDPQWTAYGSYYYVKVYGNDDSLIADFVPCYRKSDNKAGLYDLISEMFYNSDGSNDFISGPNA